MADNSVIVRIKSAMKSASDWSTINPTLLSGEIGLDSTNKLIYVGDGSTAFNSLIPWNAKELPTIASGDAGKVLTVNSGETGVEWGTITGFLPLSGGTMTGDINLSSSAKVSSIIGTLGTSQNRTTFMIGNVLVERESDSTSMYGAGYEKGSLSSNGLYTVSGTSSNSLTYQSYVTPTALNFYNGNQSILYAEYKKDGVKINYTDESSSSSARVIESSVDIVPLGWVPDFSQSTLANNQPYVAVSRKYGTSAATASRTTSTLNGIGFSARAFDADGTSGSFTIFNPGTGSIGNTRHTLYLWPNDLHVDDRHALTCNLLDSALIERGALDGSTGAMVDWYARIRSEFTPIKPNTTYTVSWVGNAIPCMFYYSSTKAYVTSVLTSNEVTSYTFTTPSGVGFVKFTWGKSGNAYITPSDISNVQLEKGSQASSFVPFTMDGVEVAEKLRICEPLVAYGTEIPSNENLNTNTYVNVGLYYRADNATVATFSNCPTTIAFTMIVRNVTKTDVNSSAKTWQYLTREITDINGNQFIQTAFCGSTVGTWVFGEWKPIIAGRKTGTLTANVGSFDEAYCRQSGDTVDIHGWLVGLSTSDSSHANAITVSGVSLPSVPIRFVFTCWLNNGIASYAGYGVIDTYGNITFVKPVANANKVSFTITYVV